VIFASLLLILVAIVLAILGVVQGSDPLLIGSILASLLTAVFLAAGARQAAAARLAAGQDGFLVPFMPARRHRRSGAGAAGGPVGAPVADAAGTVYGPPPETVDEAERGEADIPDSASDDAGDGAGGEDLAPAGDEPVEAEAPSGSVSVPGAVSSPGVVSGAGIVTIPSQDGPADRDYERLTPPSRDFDQPDRPTQVEFDLHPTSELPVLDDPDLLLGEEIALDGPDTDEDPIDEPPSQLVPPADAALIATLDTMVTVVDGRPRYHLATCVHLLGREVQELPVSEAVELGFSPCNLCEPDTTLLAQARRG
jgi:hypothetical protein